MSSVSIELGGISSEPNNSSFLSIGEPSIRSEDERRSFGETLPAQDRSDSKWKAAGIIACVTSFTVMNSFLAAVVVVSIPVIAKDLRLDANLVLWCVLILGIVQMGSFY